MVEQDETRPWDSGVPQKGNEGEPDVGVLRERNRPMVGYMSLDTGGVWNERRDRQCA